MKWKFKILFQWIIFLSYHCRQLLIMLINTDKHNKHNLDVGNILRIPRKCSQNVTLQSTFQFCCVLEMKTVKWKNKIQLWRKQRGQTIILFLFSFWCAEGFALEYCRDITQSCKTGNWRRWIRCIVQYHRNLELAC